MSAHIKQLGFDALLAAADHDNRARAFERETVHLPSTMEEGLPYFRGLIAKHHAAIMAADVETVMTLREEAGLLACHLNGGDGGYLAEEDSAGRVLERLTAAEPGMVPLWGQCGDFIVTVGDMKVRVELNGVFGIGCRPGFWPGFSAHVVDRSAPFLSETGYRSFLGIHAEPAMNMTPDMFMAYVIAGYLADSKAAKRRKPVDRRN
ncbi:hypothetical protein [Pseudorhodoplanes sp.]|uniref:hypothetical protein n=1 Tax=Pseudorhodoplanes sp. TaxID=1934341 RepID=UPI003D108889